MGTRDGKKKLVKKKKKKEEVDERSIQDARQTIFFLLCLLLQVLLLLWTHSREKEKSECVLCVNVQCSFIFVLMLIFIPLRTYFSIRIRTHISSIKSTFIKYISSISIYSHTTSHTQVWNSTP